MSELYNKIHFETYEETSKIIHRHLNFPDEPFYDIINKIDAHLKGNYTAFPYDNACSTYVESIFDKLKKEVKSIKSDMSNIRSRFWDTYLPYLFYKCGKKVFRPTKELVHMLVDTELKNLDAFFVQSPFKCIFIAIPKEVKLMNPFNIPIDGLYVAVFNKEEIHFEGFSEEYQQYKNYENSKNVVICAISDLIIEPSDPRETMYYWNLALHDGDLFEQINAILEKYDGEYQKKEYGRCNEDYDRTFLENTLSFAINALLYINSKDPTEFGLTSTKKSNIQNLKNKAKIRQAQKKTQIPYYTIGQNITIDHSYKNVIKLYEKESSHHRKLVGKWVVRGHWRNQAHGKEFKERKIIWIQPYAKGEEFAEIIEKEYVVR